jgi:hypothetical protein
MFGGQREEREKESERDEKEIERIERREKGKEREIQLCSAAKRGFFSVARFASRKTKRCQARPLGRPTILKKNPKRCQARPLGRPKI